MSEALRPVSVRLERCGKTFADGTTALQPLDLEIKADFPRLILDP